jgi:hypothetical protein
MCPSNSRDSRPVKGQRQSDSPHSIAVSGTVSLVIFRSREFGGCALSGGVGWRLRCSV